MTEEELTELENTIPALAVQALNEATRKALASGRPVVLVVNDQLVEIGPEGTKGVEGDAAVGWRLQFARSGPPREP